MTPRNLPRLLRWLDRRREEIARTKFADLVATVVSTNNTKAREARTEKGGTAR